MARLSLITVLLALCTTQAFAQTQDSRVESAGLRQSEFLYNPKAGQIDLIPGLSSTGASLKTTTSTTEAKAETSLLSGRFIYGISDAWSVGADLVYGRSTAEYENCTVCPDSIERKGLFDPEVNTQFGLELPAGTLQFEAALAFAIADSKTEVNNDGNQASGGKRLEAGVAYALPLGQNILGARLVTDIWSSERDISDDGSTPTDYKEEGGDTTTLNLFHEYQFRMVSIVTLLTHSKTDESETIANGTTTPNDDAYKLNTLGVLVPVYFDNGITLLPRLTLGTIDYEDPTIKKAGLAALGFETRFSF